MTTIGIIGLGVMGSGMAENFARQDWSLLGFDPAPGALERQPFTIAGGSVEQLAGTAEYLLMSLPGSAQVESVMATVIAHGRPGLVVVDTSTSDPQISKRIAAEAARSGVHYVDSPVSGGRTGAIGGTLRSFVGGTEEGVAAAAPVLDVLTGGRAVIVGGPGSGHLVKLLNNGMLAAHLAIVGEALAAVDAFGIAPETFIAAVNGATGRSGATEVNVPTWVLSDSFDSGFTMGLMARDVGLAATVMASVGGPVDMLALAAQQWKDMIAETGAGADFNESVRLIRAGTTTENAA